jgi:ribosome biogenesis GTPase A
VLNKADLADLTHREKIVRKLEEQNSKPCFFTILKQQNDSEAQKVILKNCKK